MAPRPTKALALPLLGALVLNLLSRTSGDPWLALASAALLALPVASLVLRPSVQHLIVEQTAPVRAVAGEEFMAVLRISNTGSRETPPGRWQQEQPGLSAVDLLVPGLAPGAATELVLTRQALGRGVHRPVAGTLTTTTPYGLFQWASRHAVRGAPVIVHPVARTGRRTIEKGTGRLAESSIPVPGAGTEVLDLRPWRPGDARREVSARASARHGRPVVLQRERDAGPSLVVLATGGGHGPAWEQAVSDAASACLAALWVGRPPVVLADPPPGRLDSVGLLDFFAGVDTAGPLRQQDLFAAAQRAGRGGTILLLAPVDAARGVQSAARSHGCRVEVLLRAP